MNVGTGMTRIRRCSSAVTRITRSSVVSLCESTESYSTESRVVDVRPERMYMAARRLLNSVLKCGEQLL